MTERRHCVGTQIREILEDETLETLTDVEQAVWGSFKWVCLPISVRVSRNF